MIRGPYTGGPSATGAVVETVESLLGTSLLWQFDALSAVMKTASDGTGSQVADGEPVGYIEPTGGTSSANATQATSTKKPTYIANHNANGPAVTFDGSDDFLSVVDAVNMIPDNWYAIAHCELTTGATLGTLLCRNTATPYDRLLWASTLKFELVNTATPATNLYLDEADTVGVKTTILGLAKAGRFLIQSNNNCRGWTTGNPVPASSGTWTIGALYNGTQCAKIALRRLIIGDADETTAANIERAKLLLQG